MATDHTYRIDTMLPAFGEATAWNLDLVRRIGAEQWEAPGLGEWTTLDLVAHTSRAYTTIVAYLQPAGDIDIDSAAAYFRAAVTMADAGVHAQIAERGRQEVKDLAPDPVTAVEERARRARTAVEEAPPGAVARTYLGTLPLADYLATRVVELTVHTVDIADAIGAAAEPPATATAVTVEVLGDLASSTAPADLIRAMTGRGALPHGFNVFA